MKATIFSYRNLNLCYLPGTLLVEDTLPRKSIAIDGIFTGTFIDPVGERLSFDHHSPVLPRHCQVPTCKQIFDAQILDWQFPIRHDGRIWVYFNDIDLDSMLSIFLLTLSKEQLTNRVEQWVNVTGSADVFGPSYTHDEKFVKIRDFLYYKILRKHTGKSSKEIISSILENFYYYAEKDTLNYSKHKHKTKSLFKIEQSLFVHPSKPDTPILLMAIQSEDPVFEEAYNEGADIVLAVRRKGERYKYSIAKKHDYIAYDLLELLGAIVEREKGWGGASSIIGSPEQGSSMQPMELLDLIKHGNKEKRTNR